MQAVAWSIAIAIQQAVTADASARHERKSPMAKSKSDNKWLCHGQVCSGVTATGK